MYTSGKIGKKLINVPVRLLETPEYITRLCDMGENSKIDLIQVFHFKLYFHFHNHKPL